MIAEVVIQVRYGRNPRPVRHLEKLVGLGGSVRDTFMKILREDYCTLQPARQTPQNSGTRGLPSAILIGKLFIQV